MRFGFSFVGLVFLLMLFVPNLLWTRHKPKSYDTFVKRESRVLLALERVGEVSVTCLTPLCAELTFGAPMPRVLLLPAAFVLMLLYEIWWIRYFRSGKTVADFYAPLLFVPVPGAVLPVCAFLLLSLCARSIPLFLAAVLLGVGHIGIHWKHYKEIQEQPL